MPGRSETCVVLCGKECSFLFNIGQSQLEETGFDSYLNRCMMKNNELHSGGKENEIYRQP